MKRRPFPGWTMVAVLSLTETISYGILIYSFTVFIEPMRDQLGWSIASLTGAYSLGLLVAGFAALPVGRWLDRHGARLPMSLGSLLAAALLVAWANVDSLWAFYLIWLGLGLAMAGVLYEPAFAVLATWFRRDRSKALTALTFFAGLASVIFIPLAGYLVEVIGWRQALLVLAGIQLLTLPLHALVLRRSPGDLGLEPDGALPANAGPSLITSGVTARKAFSGYDFKLLAIAFSLSSFLAAALSVHLVPLLIADGQAATFAAGVGGIIGLVGLPGRLILTPLGDLLPRRYVAGAIFALQALGIVMLLGGSTELLLWCFVLLYGIGFGALTPARAALLAEYYGGREFGRISARMALFNSLARAIAPVSTGAIVTVGSGDYRPLIGVLAVVAALAGLAVIRARSPSWAPAS